MKYLQAVKIIRRRWSTCRILKLVPMSEISGFLAHPAKTLVLILSFVTVLFFSVVLSFSFLFSFLIGTFLPTNQEGYGTEKDQKEKQNH